MQLSTQRFLLVGISEKVTMYGGVTLFLYVVEHTMLAGFSHKWKTLVTTNLTQVVDANYRKLKYNLRYFYILCNFAIYMIMKYLLGIIY